jgi:small subunit ribosomal protein S2
MALPTIPEVRELMDAGVHFGHASGKWHPKMAPYIFCTRDKLHIIDLEKTREKLTEVLPLIEERIASGKSFILVGTKRQVADMVRDMGKELDINFVNERWLGGTMTNFGQMMQSISRMKKTEELLSSEEANKMIKKERVMLASELKRMHAKFSGLRNFTKKPDFLIVIDPSYEHNAIKEARFEGVEIFAVVDTNSDPSQVHHVIPANDDGPKSLSLILGLLKETIASGKAKLASNKQAAEASNQKAEEKVEEIVVATPSVDELVEIEEKIEEVVGKEKKEVKSAKPASKEDKEEVTTKED